MVTVSLLYICTLYICVHADTSTRAHRHRVTLNTDTTCVFQDIQIQIPNTHT